ncbi:hypothetical protein B0H34DRAFT_680034 [Crassisporium funariophilum]|nr:hypothetical protein B0H34DRAFT_680034 [Crassisporium funariophilum]
MNNTLKTTAIIVITLISSNLALALPAPPAPPAPPPLYLPPPYAPPPVLPAPPSFAPAAADSIMTLPPTESMGYTATTMPKNFANKGLQVYHLNSFCPSWIRLRRRLTALILRAWNHLWRQPAQGRFWDRRSPNQLEENTCARLLRFFNAAGWISFITMPMLHDDLRLWFQEAGRRAWGSNEAGWIMTPDRRYRQLLTAIIEGKQRLIIHKYYDDGANGYGRGRDGHARGLPIPYPSYNNKPPTATKTVAVVLKNSGDLTSSNSRTFDGAGPVDYGLPQSLKPIVARAIPGSERFEAESTELEKSGKTDLAGDALAA